MKGAKLFLNAYAVFKVNLGKTVCIISLDLKHKSFIKPMPTQVNTSTYFYMRFVVQRDFKIKVEILALSLHVK